MLVNFAFLASGVFAFLASGVFAFLASGAFDFSAFSASRFFYFLHFWPLGFSHFWPLKFSQVWSLKFLPFSACWTLVWVFQVLCVFAFLILQFWGAFGFWWDERLQRNLFQSISITSWFNRFNWDRIIWVSLKNKRWPHIVYWTWLLIDTLKTWHKLQVIQVVHYHNESIWASYCHNRISSGMIVNMKMFIQALLNCRG